MGVKSGRSLSLQQTPSIKVNLSFKQLGVVFNSYSDTLRLRLLGH